MMPRIIPIRMKVVSLDRMMPPQMAPPRRDSRAGCVPPESEAKPSLGLLSRDCHEGCSARSLQPVDIPGRRGNQPKQNRHSEEIDDKHEQPHEKPALTALGNGCGRLVSWKLPALIALHRPRVCGQCLLAFNQPLRDIVR